MPSPASKNDNASVIIPAQNALKQDPSCLPHILIGRAYLLEAQPAAARVFQTRCWAFTF
jgi:hypothetical protein